MKLKSLPSLAASLLAILSFSVKFQNRSSWLQKLMPNLHLPEAVPAVPEVDAPPGDDLLPQHLPEAVPAVPAVPEVDAPPGDGGEASREAAREAASEAASEGSCDVPSFHWGWQEACNKTSGGDEACELFFSSNFSHDPWSLVAAAMRSWDVTYHPSTVRLKGRLVEALQEERNFTVLALGPSTTRGAGCIKKGPRIYEELRWTGALQNLSKYPGSPLQLRVINEARPATPFKTQWREVLHSYRDDPRIDLIVIDYTVTSPDLAGNRHSATLANAFVQQWQRPPAILFLETFTTIVMGMLSNGIGACSIAQNFESWDPFYSVLKALRLPLLSYPDVACQLPALNRSSKSLNGVAFLHAYNDVGFNVAAHFGCGVHFILAQVLHLYLLKMLQDSCGSKPKNCLGTGKWKELCAFGFNKTLEDAKLEKNVSVFNLSREEQCEMNIATSWSFVAESGLGAWTSTESSTTVDTAWRLGADRPGKFGWIANEEPVIAPDPGTLRLHNKLKPNLNQFPSFKQLPSTDIVFLVRLSLGLVFVDYLSSYNNIGTALCRVENLKAEELSEWVRINALWSQHMSITSRATLALNSTVPPMQRGGFNAALRCREEGKKFKIIAVSSC